MDTKCIRAIVILVVLPVVVAEDSTNNIITCYGICCAKCILLKPPPFCALMCMKECLIGPSNAQSPISYCKLGCVVDLCPNMNNDKRKMASRIGSCFNICAMT
ncbi:hypothetical protein AQUCO_04200142v1 [Aquilegia coerulea]|uniref:Bifunctional inhibitor/plant lipid transfer protein/seed storage helical domain-containing protein n=1 Tax=Aquilegia coerulea TaxID=218851 RepID=A0A2G5CPG5_AQUCA|nr:hypothetical protein AQUCO_04200142v1 [Aquilegia coerulea]